jgi:hypothetical protein
LYYNIRENEKIANAAFQCKERSGQKTCPPGSILYIKIVELSCQITNTEVAHLSNNQPFHKLKGKDFLEIPTAIELL